MGTSAEVKAPSAVLSERAKHRLRIAAALLRKRGMRFTNGSDFYGLVLAALDEQADRAQLRELVDWVEAYENADAHSVKG